MQRQQSKLVLAPVCLLCDVLAAAAPRLAVRYTG